MKQLALLAAAAAVLAAIAFALTRPKTSAPTPVRALPSFRPENVASIKITGQDGAAEIRRTPDGWAVSGRDGIPADLQKISRFLQAAWEAKPVQSASVDPTQLGRFQLAAPGPGAQPGQAGILVEFFDEKNAPLAKLTLGKRRTSDGEAGLPGMSLGRFVLSGNFPDTALLVTETFDDAAPAPAPWLDKSFVKIPDLASIERKSSDPSKAWLVNRKDGGWVPANPRPGEVLQPAKLSSAAAAWISPTFEDIATKGETVDPDGAVVLTSSDGLTYTLRRGTEIDGRVPLTVETTANFPQKRAPAPGESPEDAKHLDGEFAEKQKALQASLAQAQSFSGRVYLVPPFLADALFLTRSDLFPPPPSPTPAPSPSPAPEKQKKKPKKN